MIPKNRSAKPEDKGYQISSLVSAEHFRDSASTTVSLGGGEHRLWTIIDAKETGFKPEGNDLCTSTSCTDTDHG